MPETILTITVEPQLLSAVITTSNQDVTEIVEYVSVTEAPSLDEGIPQLIEQLEQLPEKSLLILSSDRVGFHTLTFPFQNRKKIAEVLLFELEEETSHNLDDHFHDFHITKLDDNSSKVQVALVEKDALLEPLSILQNIGIDPDIVTIAGSSSTFLASTNGDHNDSINTCCLHFSLNKLVITIFQKGALILVRQVFLTDTSSSQAFAKQLSQTLRQTLLSIKPDPITNCIFYYTGQVDHEIISALGGTLNSAIDPIKITEQPLIKITPEIHHQINEQLIIDPLGHAVAFIRKQPSFFNFRQGTLAKKNNFLNKTKILYPALGVLLIVWVALSCWAWWDIAKLEKKKSKLQAETHDTFKRTLPEVTKIVNPVQQLQVRVNQLQNNNGSSNHTPTHYSVLELLAELSTTIPPTANITLARLIAEQESIRIKGTAGDFNGVDNVQKLLQDSSYFSAVSITSANLNSKKDAVLFELKMTVGE